MTRLEAEVILDAYLEAAAEKKLDEALRSKISGKIL